MGNEESLPTENSKIDSNTILSNKVKSDLTKEKSVKSADNNRKMSISLLHKLPIFPYSSDSTTSKKELSENCSVSSDELISEDSPVTPPGPDLSHLSDSEREHIARVLARAKNIERDEDERLREIENELNFIEEAASSRSSKHSLTSDGNYCSICSKSMIQSDSNVCLSCANCGRKVCNECGMYNSDPGSSFADLLCSICQKKRHLILSSGMWFHGLCHDPFPKTLSIQDLLLSPKKSKIERTASYSQYEEMFETPNKHHSVEESSHKRTSLPCNKLKNLSFHHSSTPEINLVSGNEEDSVDNERNNDSYQQQINPEYQEVKNRYLQESSFVKAKSRRNNLQNQFYESKSQNPIETIDSRDGTLYNLQCQKFPNYINYTDFDREASQYGDYQIDDDYNFPLVDDIINSSQSSEEDEEEDYATYEKNQNFESGNTNQYNQENDFPLLDDVLEESSSPNQTVSEHLVIIDDSDYQRYSNSTFKPNFNYNKEPDIQINYDNFDRHNSLLAYYDQCDNQFEDYFYSEEEFRAIENFQLYNNELIRRSMNEENYFNRAIEQSDTDSDIAKFAASIASDTAHLTNQTFNYDEELSNTYQNRFTFQNVEEQKIEIDSASDSSQNLTPALLNTEQFMFKKSVLSPILDLSPNSSRAEEPNINISKNINEISVISPKRELLKCDHDSDEECPWCYRDSSSNVSKDNNFSSSISSSPLSSKSSSNSSLSSNETINNKSKSQLKRCQNYENISGLSESASADTLEDNNSIQEINTDDNSEQPNQTNKQAEMKKSLSLSRQQSMDITPIESNDQTEYSNTKNTDCPEEFTTDTSSSYNKPISILVPSIDSLHTIEKIQQDQKYNEEKNFNSLFIRTETITSQCSEQTHYQPISNPIGKNVSTEKNSTICNKISDTREAKFSISTTRIANEQFTEQTALTTTVSTSVPNKILLEKFTAYTDYSRTAKNSLLNKLCIQLQVPIQTKNRKSLVNEEILLVTQIKRQHLKDFVQIQNVELQLNQLRNIERQQMTEIQEKMAEIQNAKSVLSYPRLPKSRYVPNYVQNNDNSYYYYVPQRSHYRYPYPQYYYQNPYPYRQDQIYKYDPSFDDQRSSYSIHSSPQCLNYGGSYPRELKYNPYYYLDPAPATSRNFSRSTDQIAMHNFANYPLELSHSDQGLFNMAYNYPIKMNDRFAFNIDIELMQKEQRVLELEREIELRKRQIEETIRYQEELLQLAELNNVNVNEYKSNYITGNNQQMVDFDAVNEYYINEKPSRQYSDELVNPYYPYDDLPPNHQQFASYYDNLYQQNDQRDSICYAEPVFQQDNYYSQQYLQNMDTSNIYGKHQEQNSGNTFDQQLNRYAPKSFQSDKRQACNVSAQEHIDYVMQMEKDIDKVHSNNNNNNNIKGNYKQVRPLSGEYENVAQIDSDSVDNEIKQESNLTSIKHNQKKIEIGKPNKNYNFPTKRLLLMRDSKEKNLRGNGVGMRIIGGQLCSDGHLGAFVEQIFPGSVADRLQDQIKEGDELIEWNGVSLVGKTFEEVRSILKNDSDEIEFLVRVGSVPKSTETSKDSSEIIDDNTMKNLASNYDNMNIKDNSSQPLLPTKKDNINKADENMPHASFNETPTHRRTQSMKRQRAQEYETIATTQNPQKSPMKKSSIIVASHAELDCGSPTPTRRDTSLNSNSAIKPRKPSKDIIQPNNNGTEKDEVDIDKNTTSESEKILGDIQLIISFDDYDQSLTIHVAKSKNLLPMDLNGLADPFVKVRLHPDPTEDPDFNRQTRYMSNTLSPEWQQTVVFMNILKRSLRKRVLDISVWDFDRLKSNDFMGQSLISLANKQVLDGKPHWYKLTDMKEVDIPGLRQPAHRKLESKSSGKTKSASKSSKEIKNSRDENLNQPNLAYISNSSSDFPTNLPNPIPVNSIQSQLPDIKISMTLDHSSPVNKPSNLKPVRNTPHQKSPEKINNLTRTDTADSKSSNSSSVTTDFLSEEQREIVRKWLGPGQLLMLSYTQRVDKVGNLPDDSLVVAELYLSLRKIAEEDILIVTANSLKNLKSKNIIEVYIKLYLMYSEQQLSRVMKRKTKPVVLSDDNNFNESFNFHTQLEGMLLQVSLWSCGKGLNVHKMLGEAVIHLDDIEFVKKNSKKDVSGWYKLLKPDI